MKIRELAQHWEENAKGRLTKTEYAIHLMWKLPHAWQRSPRCTPSAAPKNCSAN